MSQRSAQWEVVVAPDTIEVNSFFHRFNYVEHGILVSHAPAQPTIEVLARSIRRDFGQFENVRSNWQEPRCIPFVPDVVLLGNLSASRVLADGLCRKLAEEVGRIIFVLPPEQRLARDPLAPTMTLRAFAVTARSRTPHPEHWLTPDAHWTDHSVRFGSDSFCNRELERWETSGLPTHLVEDDLGPTQWKIRCDFREPSALAHELRRRRMIHERSAGIDRARESWWRAIHQTATFVPERLDPDGWGRALARLCRQPRAEIETKLLVNAFQAHAFARGWCIEARSPRMSRLELDGVGDFIASKFPCTPFDRAGYWGRDDERGVDVPRSWGKGPMTPDYLFRCVGLSRDPISFFMKKTGASSREVAACARDLRWALRGTLMRVSFCFYGMYLSPRATFERILTQRPAPTSLELQLLHTLSTPRLWPYALQDIPLHIQPSLASLYSRGLLDIGEGQSSRDVKVLVPVHGAPSP